MVVSPSQRIRKTCVVGEGAVTVEFLYKGAGLVWLPRCGCGVNGLSRMHARTTQ